MINRLVSRRPLQLLIIVIAVFLARDISAQDLTRKPFTLDQILLLLEKKTINEGEILTLIREYKVDFVIEDQSLIRLRNEGAGSSFIDVIKANLFLPLYFTFPNDAEKEVSHFIIVNGWGEKIPDKHLWIFTHMEGLSVWWPQGGEVNLEKNGRWKHNVYIGQGKDKGISFEIKAIWVDQEAHRELEKYVQLYVKANDKYPDNCPGIQIPKGSPTAQVGVRRPNQSP